MMACTLCIDAGVEFDWCRACGRGLIETIIGRADPEPMLPENGWEWTDRHKLDMYLRVIDAVGSDGRLAWGTMTYACESRSGPSCGFEHRIWMLLGVEGPPALKAADLYVASPFFCGTCPGCGGGLVHTRWSDDEEWPTLRPLDPGVAFFRLPTRSEAAQHVRRNYMGAEYEDPTGRTIRRPNRAGRRGR